MSDAGENIIAKKIETTRKINSPIPRLNEVLAEMTKRTENDGRAYLGAVVEAMIMDVETKVFSDVLDAISMPAMIGIVDVEGVDRAAMVNLDLDLVYHVVDLRMGGAPTELPEFGARRPTSIDSALCKPMVDLALAGFCAGLRETMGSADSCEMTCAGFEHLPMLANIVPERSDVLCVTVSLDIGEAARSGNFELVLPFATIDMLKATLKKSTAVNTSASHDAWAAHMRNVILGTEAPLVPVLHQALFSVAEISALSVGDVIPLPGGADTPVDLVIESDGETVSLATARLGALKGSKALKLNNDPDAAFLAPLKRLAAET